MMRSAMGAVSTAAVLAVATLGGSAAPAPEAAPSKVVVLDQTSYWRAFVAWRTPLVRTAAGLVEVIPRCSTPFPPAGWKEPDFDDGGWLLTRGPFFGPAQAGGCAGTEGSSPAVALLCLRGRFTVPDTAPRRDFTLSLAYRGGVVVHLNGREIARSHLPKGDIDLSTLAEDYPLEAFLRPDGKPIRGYRSELRRYADRVGLRTRRIENFTLPADLLRPGVNVLAIECHRTAFPEALLFGAKGKKLFYGGRRGRRGGVLLRDAWSTVGVPEVRLAVPEGAALPNTDRPKGFQVFNWKLPQSVFDLDYGEPHQPLRPIRIVGTRNGTFSGKVVAASHEPIKGLAAEVSALEQRDGAGRIGREALQVRFPRLNQGSQRWSARRYYGLRDLRRFDALWETPPKVVPVVKKQMPRGVPAPVFGAVQPIWLTVNVPADAPPGDYRGTLTVRARGVEPVSVPVHLTVEPWRLPDPGDFQTFTDLIESPESVALYYKVPLWSDRHFQLIEKSFQQMARIGARAVYLPLICRTNLGNSQSMVRWIKKPDGSFDYDFSIFDRYLDLALKYLKPKVVCLYVWDSYTGIYSWGRKKIEKNIPHWDSVLVSLLDPKTGEVTDMEGPPFLPEHLKESEAFWRPVLERARKHLVERGLEKQMMLGLSWDHTPHKDAVALLARILPGAKWVHHAHGAPGRLHGVPVGYVATVWNQRGPDDPAVKRWYGWRHPPIFAQFDRPFPYNWPLSYYRNLAEWNIAGNQNGFGRKGADFWPVLEGRRMYPASGRLSSGRYPLSDRGNRNIYQPDWLAPGPDGAVSTVRYECAIEGVQEAEARIFIEKVLTDKARRALLPADLVRRVQDLLDRRTRAMLLNGHYVARLWYPAGGWQERSAALYRAAADVERALARSARPARPGEVPVSAR